MSRRDRRVGAFDFSGERVAGAPGELGIHVAQAGPLVVDELHRTMHDITQEQTARSP